MLGREHVEQVVRGVAQHRGHLAACAVVVAGELAAIGPLEGVAPGVQPPCEIRLERHVAPARLRPRCLLVGSAVGLGDGVTHADDASPEIYVASPEPADLLAAQSSGGPEPDADREVAVRHAIGGAEEPAAPLVAARFEVVSMLRESVFHLSPSL